jgi:hypothetical protein
LSIVLSILYQSFGRGYIKLLAPLFAQNTQVFVGLEHQDFSSPRRENSVEHETHGEDEE